jgi:hypothetical protein
VSIRARCPLCLCLALLSGMAGCTHNYYYYSQGTPVAVEPTDSTRLGLDPRSPTTRQSQVVRGSTSSSVARSNTAVRKSSPVVVQDSSPVVVRRSSPMLTRRIPAPDSPSRVVISQPSGTRVAGQDRNAWQPVNGPFDPEPQLSRGTSSAVDPTRNR